MKVCDSGVTEPSEISDWGRIEAWERIRTTQMPHRHYLSVVRVGNGIVGGLARHTKYVVETVSSSDSSLSGRMICGVSIPSRGISSSWEVNQEAGSCIQ